MKKSYTSIYSGLKLVIRPKNSYQDGVYIKFVNGRFDTENEKEQAHIAKYIKSKQGVIYDITDGATSVEKEANALKRENEQLKAKLAGKKGLVSATVQPSVADLDAGDDK